MLNRALVVDANILVRAVLGRRVREVIDTYAGEVSFFVPESAYAEAKEHLAVLVIKRGGDPEKALAILRSLGRLVELIGSEVTASSKRRLESGWAGGIQKTGRFWPRHSHLGAQSGRKTQISSGAVLPHGHQIACECFCGSDFRYLFCRGQHSSLLS